MCAWSAWFLQSDRFNWDAAPRKEAANVCGKRGDSGSCMPKVLANADSERAGTNVCGKRGDSGSRIPKVLANAES